MQPTGPAWQSEDAAIPREISVMKQFWYGVSLALYDVHSAIIAAHDEFFCRSITDDFDLWWEEYGLPDQCDPFANNLCAKVQTQGGTSIAYYEERAADLGWATEMKWLQDDDPLYPGIRATLLVIVDSANSETSFNVGHVGTWVLGVQPLGAPPTGELTCALDRLIPAHNAILVEVI